VILLGLVQNLVHGQLADDGTQASGDTFVTVDLLPARIGQDGGNVLLDGHRVANLVNAVVDEVVGVLVDLQFLLDIHGLVPFCLFGSFRVFPVLAVSPDRLDRPLLGKLSQFMSKNLWLGGEPAPILYH
jgi:hypothetical protein